jgi:hypothetical protein
MRSWVFFFGVFIVSSLSHAKKSDIYEFNHWVHRSTPELNIDIVHYAESPDKSMIFVIDPKIGCDARLVYANQQLDNAALTSLDGERFSWKLSGVVYQEDQASKLNTDGYTRFELISFYKHHFNELEELLAPEGIISFSVEDPQQRFETQSIQHKAEGLSQALNHALDRCQGWM